MNEDFQGNVHEYVSAYTELYGVLRDALELLLQWRWRSIQTLELVLCSYRVRGVLASKLQPNMIKKNGVYGIELKLHLGELLWQAQDLRMALQSDADPDAANPPNQSQFADIEARLAAQLTKEFNVPVLREYILNRPPVGGLGPLYGKKDRGDASPPRQFFRREGPSSSESSISEDEEIPEWQQMVNVAMHKHEFYAVMRDPDLDQQVSAVCGAQALARCRADPEGGVVVPPELLERDGLNDIITACRAEASKDRGCRFTVGRAACDNCSIFGADPDTCQLPLPCDRCVKWQNGELEGKKRSRESPESDTGGAKKARAAGPGDLAQGSSSGR